MENINGRKKSNEIGTPMKMLFANTMVFSIFLCSRYEKRIVIKLTNGKEIKKPDKTGFFSDNQLAKEIMIAEKSTFKMNNKLLSKEIFDF